MVKRLITYGDKAWLDEKFDTIAAKQWLGTVDSGNPDLHAMLTRVADGEYTNINKKITEFVIELQRSKHAEDDALMTFFFKRIVTHLVQSMDLEMVTIENLSRLRANTSLIHFHDILDAIDVIIATRSNPLPG